MIVDTLQSDIARLCAAIDERDDTVLPILADALEEAGDERAVGLRLIGDRRPWGKAVASKSLKGQEGFVYRWWWYRARPCWSSKMFNYRLGYKVFDKLTALKPRGVNYIAQIGNDRLLPYNTRSDAFLALAEALMETSR